MRQLRDSPLPGRQPVRQRGRRQHDGSRGHAKRRPPGHPESPVAGNHIVQRGAILAAHVDGAAAAHLAQGERLNIGDQAVENAIEIDHARSIRLRPDTCKCFGR